MTGQSVEKRGFSAAGSPGDNQIHFGFDETDQELGHFRAETAETDQIIQINRFLAEFPDGEQGPLQADRRNHRVHPASVGEAGIHHW